MPLPFIVAGIAAAVGAVGTTAAAVGAGAVAVGAATATAIGAVSATAVAIAGTTLLTVGGIAITAGTIAGVAAGAAIVFGISEVAMQESESYSTIYISDSEKRREKERLEKSYQDQIKSLEDMKKNEIDAELKSGITVTIENATKFIENDEYYNAINLIKNFKLVYAENKNNKRIGEEASKLLNEILEVRRQTLELRDENE